MAGRGNAANLTNVGKGRPKGSVNKNTKLAKEAIAAVAEGLGGVDRMIAWAQEDDQNERVFWSSIYTKLIPVQTEHSGTLTVMNKEQRDASVAAATRVDG